MGSLSYKDTQSSPKKLRLVPPVKSKLSLKLLNSQSTLIKFKMVKIATFSVVLLVPIALALPNPLNFLKSRQYAQFPDLGAVANNVPNFGDPVCFSAILLYSKNADLAVAL